MQLTPFSANFSLASQPVFLPLLPKSEHFSNVTMALLERPIEVSTRLFLKGLKKRISNDAEESQNIDSLITVFKIVISESNKLIKESMTKKHGYFSRLFSSESWVEWTEDKTSLGIIVSLFASHVNEATPIRNCMHRLDSQTIKIANTQAAKLVTQLENSPNELGRASNCFKGLVLGAAGSLVTQNPVPIGLATLNCLSEVEALRKQDDSDFRDDVITEFDQNRDLALNVGNPKTIPSVKPPGYNPSIVDSGARQRLKWKLYSEVGKYVPKALEKYFTEGENWIDAILIGGFTYVMDYTQISVPNDKVIKTVKDADMKYWQYEVLPEYEKIFKTPQLLFNGKGVPDYEHEKVEMENKLASYGYRLNSGLTPLEFVISLKMSGVCELYLSECPKFSKL